MGPFTWNCSKTISIHPAISNDRQHFRFLQRSKIKCIRCCVFEGDGARGVGIESLQFDSLNRFCRALSAHTIHDIVYGLATFSGFIKMISETQFHWHDELISMYYYYYHYYSQLLFISPRK